MITWLASYPKSGNTWARAFLAAYAQAIRGNRRFDLKTIPSISDSESHLGRYADLAGKPGQDLTTDEINAFRKPVQSLIAKRTDNVKVVKTHNARVLTEGTPLICSEWTRRAIYLVRNPLDVIDSMADHTGRGIDEAIQLLANRKHKLGSSAGMVPQYLDSWSVHVSSWVDHDAFPVLVVRYEDLLEQPEAMFANVIRFLEWEFDAEVIQWAVEQTSFDSLQRLEAETGFAELSPLSKEKRFFRRGQKQAWPVILSRPQAERIIEEHHRSMQLVGYPSPDLEAIYSDPELAKRRASFANEARQREQELGSAGGDPSETPVDTSLPRAIAKQLIQGTSPQTIVEQLVRQGIPAKVASDAVSVADSHLYIAAAREVVASLQSSVAGNDHSLVAQGCPVVQVGISNASAEVSSQQPALAHTASQSIGGETAPAARSASTADPSERSIANGEIHPDVGDRNLIAYEIYPVEDMPLIPAPFHRQWMDETQKRFAYRCLPMTLANQAGWLIGCPVNFSVRWNGGPRVEDVTVFFDEGVEEKRISSLFGRGTFTFNMPYLFRTPKEVNLWVRGPTNLPKDGVTALEGLVETDWATASFTMNWKLTRPGQLVRFQQGDPICMVVPFPRGFLESLVPVREPIESNPEVQAKYLRWSASRTEFQEQIARGDVEAKKRDWQKDYFQGRDPGETKFDGHQTKIRLEPFRKEVEHSDS